MRMIVGIGSLLLLWMLCGATVAQPKDAMLPDRAWPPTVIGNGPNEEAAKQNALEQAVRDLKARLTAFDITEKYVRDFLVDEKECHPGEEIKLPGIERKFWVLTFRPDYGKGLIHRDQEAQRKLRAEERQTWTSRVLIGLAFLLAAGVGYVRLDEYTRRRYTGWLRLAGVGVAASVAAGWWRVFQGGW